VTRPTISSNPLVATILPTRGGNVVCTQMQVIYTYLIKSPRDPRDTYALVSERQNKAGESRRDDRHVSTVLARLYCIMSNLLRYRRAGLRSASTRDLYPVVVSSLDSDSIVIRGLRRRLGSFKYSWIS
jgi:hypothetical protein